LDHFIAFIIIKLRQFRQSFLLFARGVLQIKTAPESEREAKGDVIHKQALRRVASWLVTHPQGAHNGLKAAQNEDGAWASDPIETAQPMDHEPFFFRNDAHLDAEDEQSQHTEHER
jgi:hypothetical protein